MRMHKLVSLLIIGVVSFASCKNESIDSPKGNYENGMLISGEGSAVGSGSVSFVSQNFNIVENLIYKKVNLGELGTNLQSIAFNNDNAYIVVDNQNTITAVDRYSFEKRGEITTDLFTPRYMVVVGNKGYVTNWGSTADETDDFIAIVNLDSFIVEGTISVGNGPERIIESNGKLYVSHKGAFTTNNVISVIDIASEMVQEVTVNDNPDELFFNNAGQLVVLSSGRVLYDALWNVTGDTPGSIAMIDTTSLEIVNEFVFSEGEHPSVMVLENDTIYYNIGNNIYAINESATSLSTTTIIEAEGYLYGIAVQGDALFILNANFTDLSFLNVYSIATKTKTQTKEIALGASKIYFN